MFVQDAAIVGGVTSLPPCGMLVASCNKVGAFVELTRLQHREQQAQHPGGLRLFRSLKFAWLAVALYVAYAFRFLALCPPCLHYKQQRQRRTESVPRGNTLRLMVWYCSHSLCDGRYGMSWMLAPFEAGAAFFSSMER
jgi:hypothetical protein